ncbi:4Fe-4S dicluster domain-containing protein [Nocardioides sp.]|uniref:4Fe-4S dicluster domain-containing protein n=1 Tax=Nocardioides sp. TaxID=35761 RepID=UPI00352992D7
MQYGFAIDQRTCIGCHACTVACKTEHEVPLGQFRTWVKYVDSGAYPETQRDMGVMRCNHCTDAPCVAICPTQALFKREDGIVDFDNSRCIGCKSCMQACPYDAIYIDEDTHTAAKCNFCSHRVDQGLEPACVVVCPTESIWVGDLDDPESAISQFVATNTTQVRSPEQNTGPNVHYVGASPSVLQPLAAPVDDTYIWAQPDKLRTAIKTDLTMDPETMARTTLNTAHPRPWGWMVSTYLWTKGVAAGAMMLAGLVMLFGGAGGTLGEVVAPLLAMAGLLSTALLLILDLKRPERFWMLLLKPNPTSWLFKGGLVLSVAAGLSFLWFVFGLVDAPTAIRWLAGPAVVAGALTAGYTAFLFKQAEGRDLWQNPLLFWHLLAQAFMVGSGLLLVLGPFMSYGDLRVPLLVGLLAGTVLHLMFVMIEIRGHHGTDNAQAGVKIMTGARYGSTLQLGNGIAVVAAVLALAGFFVGGLWLGALGGIAAQVALLMYEHVFVRAGQEVPLS